MNTAYRKWAICFVVVVCGLILTHSNKASAAIASSQAEISAATGKFVDRSTIILTIAGKDYTFKDSNIGDTTNVYTTSGTCLGDAIFFPDGHTIPVSGSNATASLNLDFVKLSTTNCVSTAPPSINVTIEASQANATFVWVDAGTIHSVFSGGFGNGNYIQATQPPGVSPNLFIGSETKCADLLVLQPNGTVHFYQLENNNNAGNDTFAFVNAADAAIMAPWFPPECEVLSTFNDSRSGFPLDAGGKITSPNWFVGQAANITKPPGTGTVGGGGTVNGPVEDSCANAKGTDGFGLRWAFCPLLDLLDGVISWLDDSIQGLLIVKDPSNAANFGGSSALHEAWGQIRNIALIILIPIMLFMVIGTALNVSFLDAYTVRRAMPRFLIAILFISVSWYITAFLINLTNTIGTGILGLMTGPFGISPQTTLSELISTGGAQRAGSEVIGMAIFGGLVVAGIVSFGIIMSYALVAALVLGIGFILLIIRQLLILTLVLFAPLAILSWIFPNNDKLWKLWWGTFSKMLIMFPLIMILIGGGKIFAWVVAHTQ